jgi:alcohol dehydrogenase-like protein/zinc-binding dehydrogenase
MRGTVLYGTRDVRFEEVPEPKISKPTVSIIRLAATCVCGSDLWSYRGISPVKEPTLMGHEYCGIVEEVGSAVKTVTPGKFRHRLLLCFGQCVPSLQLWLSVFLPAARIRRRSPGSTATCSSCGRHSRADSRSSCEGDDSEPSRYLRCFRDGLVCRRRGERKARHDDCCHRRRSCRSAGRALRQADGRGDEGVARIKDLTKGVGADAVLECVGTQESMMQAIRSTRASGYVSPVGVPHGVELQGEELFFSHVHLDGGPHQSAASYRS